MISQNINNFYMIYIFVHIAFNKTIYQIMKIKLTILNLFYILFSYHLCKKILRGQPNFEIRDHGIIVIGYKSKGH